MTTRNLLEVTNLSVKFPLLKRGLLSKQVGEFTAVDQVSFEVQRGSVLGIVGESGSGKTTLVRAILRAIEPSSGSVLFQGNDGAVDLCQLTHKQLMPLRTQMQMIFQDPFASLNPRMKVADIIAEPLVIHHPEQPLEHRQQVIKMLERVGLEADSLHRFPHAFFADSDNELVLHEHSYSTLAWSFVMKQSQHWMSPCRRRCSIYSPIYRRK